MNKLISPDRATYWFRRDTSPNNPKSKSLRNSNGEEDHSIESSLNKEIERFSNYIKELDQMKQFYSLLNTTGKTSDNKENNEIRCFKHNSSIIIYCETDHQLLCSNCLFDGVEHQKHKLLEINKLCNNIRNDLKRFEKSANSFQARVSQQKQEWNQWIEEVERRKVESIFSLEREHSKHTAALSKRFLESKTVVE